jgi:hypothetical protein
MGSNLRYVFWAIAIFAGSATVTLALVTIVGLALFILSAELQDPRFKEGQIQGPQSAQNPPTTELREILRNREPITTGTAK